MGKSIKGPE